MAKITQVYAREILNSKAAPTVEATIVLDNGISVRSAAPTGTSIGKYEVKDLRDGDPAHYGGFGVQKACQNIIQIIAPQLVGQEATAQHEIDKIMLDLDGTQDKSKLGANAIIAVSMAAMKAGAASMGVPLFKYVRMYTSIANAQIKIPTPGFNIINGGKHAGNNLDFQEFLVIPASSMPYAQALNTGVTIYHKLKDTLQDKGATTLIGDEGGFGPTFATNRDALIMLSEAISASNYRMNYDVFLGIDAAASNFFHEGKYQIKDKPGSLNAKDLVTIYEQINDEYNLLYLEDPFDEDDWAGWTSLTNITAKNTMVVGDDLTTTNIVRLQTAISKKAISGLIIKPNQIGTIIETLAVVEAARNAGLKLIVSHRSGDTDDDFIADFAVGIGADYTKFGAPARGERTAKYNRLLEIDAMLGNR